MLTVKVFSHHLMIKTAVTAPFLLAKLQKPESNGYVNHTVVSSSPFHCYNCVVRKSKAHYPMI